MSSKQKTKAKGRDGAPSAKITDARFASFETDPRYALPSKRKTKTTIDKRFSRMLKDDDFTSTAKTDRYGRKIKSDSKRKALQRLYQEEDEDEQAEENAEDDDDDDVEVEADDVVRRELEKAKTKYDPARGGGFSSSESDSDSSEDEDDDDDSEEEVDNAPDMQQYRTQQAEVETGEITNRIAIVNLDWDNIKSVDLMALCNSFVPLGGRIEKVSIYPSEFGKERMQREELEGPPKEIFKKSSGDEDDETSEDDEEEPEDDGEDSDEEAKNDLFKEENDEDFDSDALRTYQLDRLRYYYAVMICSDKNTAQKIYEETDGSEYLSSSNFLDLRFVPDDVTFDDEPRDECKSVPKNYKPVEFVTDALQHSKVKLTWDMHPEDTNRKEIMKNAFSGSRDGIAENDIKAYLASGSEDEEDEEEDGEGVVGASDAPKLSKKELARKKMREALGFKDEPSGKSSKSGGPVGDMQITFTSALTEDTRKKAPGEETTAEKYIRKERERKAKRKEQALANRQGAKTESEEGPQEDLGFDDPFFTAEEPEKKSKSAMNKEERRKKREAREAEEKQNAEEKAQLQLLMADNPDEGAGHLDHFDMNEILKAEKNKKKKGKKGRKDTETAADLQDDFRMDVHNDRFKAVFEDHEFAIDPSNPKFKGTVGMKSMLEEGRRKRKHGGDEAGSERRRDQKSKKQSRQLDQEEVWK
ncbi:hypothetical protein M406DRAFT_97667 [Cryphonectria parasitica EP155]|uniref:NUC153 domain-containing protein n=1 Tax=Cryphonectria parasitica (strain ATCC 38755 / EP155) TaxID=660469 RepID=A0A9P4Y4Y6_CRYP1|nr:uncharacterized protein M406DRAFT_97667 [Cryphonectria parasitica EP155]KAF3766798.1 hypothetical protein M406DRAFT_97667 [Cryphonectria parasitica EP155]